ncbi:MAG: TfoX/Sxy family DNA transformation protein [Gammaproteobacteria bacterium]
MRNLGPRSRGMLANAGIVSDAQLKAMGAVAAFIAVKRAGGKPSLNLLWALEGALTNRDWKEVARRDRLSLLTQLEAAEARRKG